MWETRVRSLGWEDTLEKGKATNSSSLAWRIDGQRSPVGYRPWHHKELDTTEHAHTHTDTHSNLKTQFLWSLDSNGREQTYNG